MKWALIFASLIAVGFARIEINQQLDGSMVEIIDDVIGTNSFRDGTGIFKRSVLEGGLGFGISRERRDISVTCLECSYAFTTHSSGTAHIQCVEEIDPCIVPSSYCCKKKSTK